jgi:hypothetical protein
MTTRRFVDYLVEVGAFLIILEPFWMLLPFAGFLYGSFLSLEVLKHSRLTVWLLYFVFPVQTLLPLAAALLAVGFSVFFIGALQINVAKIRKSGMVKDGLYRTLRRPQYTGLALFCAGMLLIWGRVIGYILFFVLLLDSPTRVRSSNLLDSRQDCEVLGALQVNGFDMTEAAQGRRPVNGDVVNLRPPEGESSAQFTRRMEGILTIYLTGLRKKILPINRLIERA